MLPALPLACQTSALLMSYAPNGVPSRTLTSNLEFRKLPLCALSYGDELLRASGNAPELGTHQVRPAYKAAVLFEYARMNGGMPWACTTSSKRRTHSLAPKPGPLDRLTFQIGPRGRTCTCNLSGLSGTPLHWATRGGAHGRIRTDTVRVLSAPSLRWTTWAKWCRVRDFHPQPLRSERSVSCSWTNAA